MFDIKIDATGLGQAMDKLFQVEAAIAAMVPQQLVYIQSVWLAAVQGHVLPGMTRSVTDDRYAAMLATPAALQYPFNGNPFSGRVTAVDGALASRHEDGYASFDMKPGLLNGPNAKTDKSGHRYNVVPFTHSTPGSQGQKGTPMPQPIYDLAKQMGGGDRLSLKGDMEDFGRRSKNPWVVNLEARLRSVPEPMAAGYTWRSSPYEGMVRVKKPGHTSYMTFRRVTEAWTDKKGRRHGSAPDSWIHPGMAANPIMGSVVAFVEPHVQKAIDQLVADIIGGA